MKILHTSDWHLGHILYGYDRHEEQKAMLQQVINIVESEKPDLFLLCGDIFHTSLPSAATQTMFVEAMTKIHAVNPDMPTVIIAGNHDSASRHEIYSVPWRKFNIHMVGTLHTDNPTDHIIELPDKGYIVALPYVHNRFMPDGWIQTLLDEVGRRNTAMLPVIMTGHTTVKGSDFSGHDDVTEYSVGGIEGMEIADMGEGWDYLALGHIHHRQWVDGSTQRMRYSGSPMAVSFDEDYSHTVSIVELHKHGDMPSLREIEIENPWPLHTLPAKGSTDWENAKQLLAQYPDDRKVYLRINVEVADFLPAGANEEAAALIHNKKCRFCLLNTTRRITETSSEHRSLSVQELKKISPLDIAARYIQQSQRIEMDEELINLLKEVVDIVRTEEIL